MSYTRSPSPFPASRFRPSLETMEGRFCPSTTLDPPADPPLGQTDNIAPTITPAAGVIDSGTFRASVRDAKVLDSPPVTKASVDEPTITLSVFPLDHRWVLLTGQVTDNDPGGLTVTFSGEYNGAVLTEPDGSFTKSVEALDLGDILASVTNRANVNSNVAVAAVTTLVPTIVDFYAVRQVGTWFTFYGQVEDEWAPGLQVTLGGFNALNNQTATVREDGTFQFTAELDVNDCGMAWARVADWWGQNSPDAQRYVDASY